VAHHRHGSGPWNTCALEVAPGMSSEVVQDAAGHAGRATRCPPRPAERTDRRSVAMKDAAYDAPGFLQPFLLGALGEKHLLKGRRKRKRPAVAVLRRAWIEPDAPSVPIDLSPLDRKNLVLDPPAGEVRKRHDRPERRRQRRADGVELRPLKNPVRTLSSRIFSNWGM
jgi:hypothetical protein